MNFRYASFVLMILALAGVVPMHRPPSRLRAIR